jgi:hypothetical protein
MSCLAVAGRPVGEDVLSSCCSLEMQQVRGAVRALGLARLLRAPDEMGAFQLRHVLLAEAVREALLPGERREWHMRLARSLIGEGHATSSGEIAEHYRAAGDTGSELAWRVRAGQHADAAGMAAIVLALPANAQRPAEPDANTGPAPAVVLPAPTSVPDNGIQVIQVGTSLLVGAGIGAAAVAAGRRRRQPHLAHTA